MGFFRHRDTPHRRPPANAPLPARHDCTARTYERTVWRDGVRVTIRCCRVCD